MEDLPENQPWLIEGQDMGVIDDNIPAKAEAI